MKERHRWKIALTASPNHARFAPILLKGDLAGAFRTAAELGCQGVELHLQRPGDVDRAAVQQLIARYDLAVTTIGTGMAAAEEGLTFADPDPAVRACAVDRASAQVRLASEFGSAVTIGLMSGRIGPCPADQRAARRRQALDSLAEVCQAAAPLGVTVLLEPLNRYEGDYINTLADGMAIAEEIGAANLKLLADTFHMNIEEADLVAGLRAAGTSIGYVHLADTNRQAPGHGHMDVAGILRALSETGYEGYIALEVLPLPDADTAIRDGVAAIRASAS